MRCLIITDNNLELRKRSWEPTMNVSVAKWSNYLTLSQLWRHWSYRRWIKGLQTFDLLIAVWMSWDFLRICQEVLQNNLLLQLDLYQPFITLHQPVRANEDCAEYLSVWMLKLTEVHWSAACASSHMNVFFTPCYCCLLHFEDAWVHPYLARRH